MSAHRWFALVLAGCWTSSAPRPPAPPAPHGMAFPVDPRLLSDDSLVARLDHHAWLTRYGRGWIDLDEELPATSEAVFDTRRAVTVLDVAPDRVQILQETDDARLGVWVERRDLAPTIVQRVQLAGDASHGLWLDPGTEITKPTVGARREFDLLGDTLRAHGAVAPDVIGEVWVGPAPHDDAEATAAGLVPDTVIRVAPDANARVLAEVTAYVGATVVKTTGAWSEVEVRDRGIHVRGFVAASGVTDEGIGRMFGMEGVGGYGISDTSMIEVPAGACMYARPHGPVVGVNTKQRDRYIHGGTDDWPAVVVQTAWGLTPVTVHVVGHSEDTPQLAMCTR